MATIPDNETNATFGELKVGDEFLRQSSDTLRWTKSEPFTAYGHMKNQNASALFSHPKISRWHYDKIADDERVVYLF